MFILVLCYSQKKETVQHPSTDEYIIKTWCIHKIQVYSAIKRNEILIHAKIWMNLQYIGLMEAKQKDNILYDSICMKCAEEANPESRLRLTRGWEESGTGNDCLIGFSLWLMKLFAPSQSQWLNNIVNVLNDILKGLILFFVNIHLNLKKRKNFR